MASEIVACTAIASLAHGTNGITSVGLNARPIARYLAFMFALAAIADRGNAAALEYAELVESPATRGAVLISIWFDPTVEGSLRRRVSYERALE